MKAAATRHESGGASPPGPLPTGLHRLEGSNFSGRSDWIKSAAAEIAREKGMAVTIPPEIHPALSGLMPTVTDELEIHAGREKSGSKAWKLYAEWSLRNLGHRDPMTLSGGQQALLTILCKLATTPDLLALDGALEQLDPVNAARVLHALGSDAIRPPGSLSLVSHNGSWPEGSVPPSLQFERPSDTIQAAPPPFGAEGFDPMQIDGPPTLELRNLSFRYPSSPPVLKDFNATLEQGRIIRFKGPNGAGKTTLTRILCGILKPSGGSILVNGQEIHPYRHPGRLVQMHFQNPDLQLFESTVDRELVSLPGEVRAAARKFAGLEAHGGTHPFDLPFVLKKRLSLALILFSRAPWLVFDEPTLGLDCSSRDILARCLEKLIRHGRGVILISHNEDFLKSFPSISTVDIASAHDTSPIFSS